MKVTTFLILLSFTQTFALSTYGQKTKLNLKTENSSIETIFEKIENESEFRFFYESNDISSDKTFDLDIENGTIMEILDEILPQSNLTYEIIDKYIAVSKLDASVSKSVIESILSTQQKVISGMVVDDTGQPLPGVTVVLKGTTQGTITDFDGKYSFPGVTADATLQFSFVGMKSQEVVVGNKTTINITLLSDAIGIEEVVAIGYATKTKSEVTGSIANVTAEELGSLPTSSVANALQGRVAGAFVTQSSGEPGAGSDIYIRGPISLAGGKPLYVVDGVPVDDLDYSFNMEDVASINVLKDASAAAIYGAKAANGVILVTTKRGGNKATVVSINASYGLRKVINMPEIFGRDDYIKAKALAGYDVVDLFGPESGWSSLPDVNWFEEEYRTGIEQNYTVSISGGSDKSTFYLSGNYNKTDGTYLDNWVDRVTFRINSDHQITPKIKFTESVYLKKGQENPWERPGNGFLTFRKIPMMPVYDETNVDGGGWGMGPKGFQGRNNVAHQLSYEASNKDYSVNASGTIEYEIIDGLIAKAFFGAEIGYRDHYHYWYPYNDGAFSEEPAFNKVNNKNEQYIATYTLNYNKTFGNHKITGLLGYEARKRDMGDLSYSNLYSFTHEPQSSSLATTIANLDASFLQTDVLDRILSQFARIDYSFNGKYLLTANVRRDGYGSKFGPENKYGVFPGVSAGWILSRESFMADMSNITMLKLRAGYGVLGNAVGEDFAYASYYTQGRNYDWSTGNGEVNKEIGLAIADRLANPEIQWESVATTNIGLDIGLLRNRLSFNIDYYSRQTKKMLYEIPIASSAGVGSSVQANIGQMSNIGMEIVAMYKDKLGDISYDVTFNGGFNKNELISLDPDVDRLYVASGDIGSGESGQGYYGLANPCRSEPGQPLGQFFGLETAGIYDTDAAEGSRPTFSGYTPQAGDLIYVDQNKDGMINVDDNVYIGNPWPKFTYGLNLGLNWKGIDVRAQFSGVYGNDIYNAFESWEYSFFSDYNTTEKIYETSFFGSNGLTDKPKVGTLTNPDYNKNWGLVSDYHVQKGSYLRLKNLQIGYQIPSAMMSRLPFESLKVYMTADNIFTITKYEGMNPEIPSRDGTILTQGLDLTSQRYPTSRIVLFGINIVL